MKKVVKHFLSNWFANLTGLPANVNLKYLMILFEEAEILYTWKLESSGFFARPFSTTSILGFLSLCDNTVLFDAFVSLWPKFNPTHPVGDRVYVTLKADIVMKAR